MNDLKGLKKSETLTLELRALYERYGYRHFCMGNFEEYDFYLANKSFLTSDKVIAFSDLDGRLMALKPDVTLSIVKNAKAGDKFYYVENVYRPSASGVSFKEIGQLGLEAIGNVDVFTECEVLTLAAESLKKIDKNYVLDVSHMGIINALCEKLGKKSEYNSQLIEFLTCKNSHEATAVFGGDEFLSAVMRDDLKALERLNIPEIQEHLAELHTIITYLKSKKIKVNLDFSLVNDGDYYNGIIFRGFVEKVPHSVLNGGRYDKLLKNLKKDSQGLGFAVYLDGLDVYDDKREFDCDLALVYGKNDFEKVLKVAENYRKNGYSVRAVSELPPDLRCREIVILDETEGKNA